MVSKQKAACKDKHKANHWKGFLDRTQSSSGYAEMVDSFITLRSKPLTSTVRDENCLMNEWEMWKNSENIAKTFSSIHLYQEKEKEARKKKMKDNDPQLTSNYPAWQDAELSSHAEHDACWQVEL